jgi:G:T-mismatch repair DNA endonuclease (very short patch repair protein)
MIIRWHSTNLKVATLGIFWRTHTLASHVADRACLRETDFTRGSIGRNFVRSRRDVQDAKAELRSRLLKRIEESEQANQ